MSQQGVSTPPPRRWLTGGSEIARCLLQHRKGVMSKRELLRSLAKHRAELFVDDPQDGNLLHDLIRRGHTKALLHVILPDHPDAVLACEAGPDGRPISLLRHAVERKDRAVVVGIVQAIARVVEGSIALPLDQRTRILESLLQLSDWRRALQEYPTLIDLPAIRGLFALQPSSGRVLSDDPDHRVIMGHGELRLLGSSVAFPHNFWAQNPRSHEPNLLSWESLRALTTARTTEAARPEVAPLTDIQACARGLKEIGRSYHELTETAGVEVEAFVVGIPGALRPGRESLLKLCCQLVERTGKTWIFELEAVEMILQYKWNTFGRPVYKALLCVAVALAVNYSLSSAYVPRLLRSEVRLQRHMGVAWQVSVLVNAVPVLLQEYWQLRMLGCRAYFQEASNIHDLLILIFVYTTTSMRFFLPLYYVPYHVMSAFACLMLWFRLVAYLRGFQETGALVRMMWSVAVDIRWFLLVLGISVIGFSNALYLIFQIDIEHNSDGLLEHKAILGSYGSLFHTALMLFAALNSNLDYAPFDASSVRELASFIYCCCIICNTIILLNLLIALMGDTYDRVQESAIAQGRYEQALSVLEIENMLPPSLLDNERLFPKWLQVLKPKTGATTVSETDHWAGRIRQISKKIEASEARISDEVETVRMHIAQLEARLVAHLGLPPVMQHADSTADKDNDSAGESPRTDVASPRVSEQGGRAVLVDVNDATGKLGRSGSTVEDSQVMARLDRLERKLDLTLRSLQRTTESHD